MATYAVATAVFNEAFQMFTVYNEDRTKSIRISRENIDMPLDLGEEVYKFDNIGAYFLQGTKIFYKKDDVWSISAQCKHHPLVGRICSFVNEYSPSFFYFMRSHYIAGHTCKFTAHMCLVYDKYPRRSGRAKIPGNFVFRVPQKKVKVDQEFNRGTIPDFKPPELSIELQEGVVKEDIYNNFEKYMNQTFMNAPYKIGKHSGHMTVPIDVGTPFDAQQRCEPYLDKTSKFPGKPFVTIFPKYQTFTSNGKLRIVFPPSSGLQRFLEDEVGNREPDVSPHVYVKGPTFHHHIKKFQSYDVISADKTLWPYYIKYVKKYFPDLIDYFIPKVIQHVNPGWTVGYPTQFPSGLYGLTSIVGPCFAAAICDTLGVGKAYIQGDGFVFPIDCPVIEHEYIRRDVDNQVNGFFYDETFHFVNGPKKLAALRCITPGRMNGIVRWEFRREIYSRLNAINLPPPRSESIAHHFQQMSNSMLMRTAQEEHERIPGKYLDFFTNNIDFLPHSMVACPVDV